ncbi:HAL2-like Inositol monophosphatase family protein [Klebsormidium nitens]|uniref:3'(2'),5'-bisphosphate nucleotidase n=1 Tax=Klebsormidium nitens TaxID=105231 RepID=A0A1Y1I7V8_KLENI|nr:HAL2-like Inositol monophosphatase family protein [Klebsormidium nitens]|eukprot:GAQ86032.1 HAL2-like Inositol monophosphatase family protein [Klebsormidium nitens]
MRVLLRERCLIGKLDFADASTLSTAFNRKVVGQVRGTRSGFASSGLVLGRTKTGFLSQNVAQRSRKLANSCKQTPRLDPVLGSVRSYWNSSGDLRSAECGWRNPKFGSAQGSNPQQTQKGTGPRTAQAQQSPVDSVLIQDNAAASSDSAVPDTEAANALPPRQVEEAASTSQSESESNGRGITSQELEADPTYPEAESSSNARSEREDPTKEPGTTTSAEFSVREADERGLSRGDQEYVRELEVATYAVHLACLLSQRIQRDILRDREQAKLKKDQSLVTIADYGVQAVISYILSEAFPQEPLSMVAEESSEALRGREEMPTLRKVVDAVNDCLSNSPLVGLPVPSEPLSTIDVLKAINRGAHEGGKKGRFWVLDPVDGTLGFVRGDQYAVALALVDQGEVVLGVLGCPNLPLRKEWMRYGHRFYRAAEAFFPPEKGLWHKGIVFRARKGGDGAWAEPLISADVTLESVRAQAMRAFVSPVTDPAQATFCEPVEKANSNQSLTAGLAQGLGISTAPLRAYSMAKYGMLAKGDAEIFMKFARGDYKEKIWDHAAGCFIVEEAGGVVTDAGGRPLDFSRGRFLMGLDRGIIASSNPFLHRRLLAALDASYDSSTL